MARRRNELERLYGNGKGLPSAVEDDRARLMPETSINPEVGSKLIDLSVLDATRAFGKKIWRVVKLRELSAYNLPMKKKEDGQERTEELVKELATEEAEARKNLRTMADLEATLENFPTQIESLKKSYKINKDKVTKLDQKLREIRSAAANLAEQVSDFSKAERIPDLEADLAQQTGWRKVLRGAHLVASKALYDQASDDRYQNAYQSQAEIEEQIRELEASIKREKGVDLTSSPVEENLNAQTAYDPARLSYADFKSRQEWLVKRLQDCVGVPGEYQTGKEELEQQKEEFAKKKKENKRAAKAVKAFESGRRYKLERLLWHEFGDQIALIRGWQARLPKMSHLGPDAYMSHVTAINRDYESLRAEIDAFETANSISGLVQLLDFELGVEHTLDLKLTLPVPAAPVPGPSGGGVSGAAGASAGGPSGAGGMLPLRPVRPRTPAVTRRLRPSRSRGSAAAASGTPAAAVPSSTQTLPPAPPVAPPSSPAPVIEVQAEVIELPLSDEQVKNTPLDEQKKIVQKNLTRIFGLDSTQSTIVWNILGDLETTRPDKFAKYIGLICLFSDALEFLFRLRYQDQPLQIPDKKLKALPAKPKDRQSMHGSKILDVLDSPNRLQVLAATLRSGKLQEVISGLTAVGEIYNWFKTLK